MLCLRVCCLPVTGAPQRLTQERNSFIFNSWKTSQRAHRSDFLESTSQLLRVTKETQAPSLFLLHHSNMQFLFSRSIHSSRGRLECQPFILIPSCRKKEELQKGPTAHFKLCRVGQITWSYLAAGEARKCSLLAMHTAALLKMRIHHQRSRGSRYWVQITVCQPLF